MNPVARALNSLLHSVLRPVVSLLLRHGIAYAEFSEIARRVFVETAAAEQALPGKKQSVSRISLLTGINRKEVKRLLEASDDDQPVASNNRAARVIGAWMRDERFHDANGNPAVLSWGNNTENGFEQLVQLHSGDIPARAILDELLRVGAVRQNDDASLRLLSHGYIPASSDDELIRLSAQYAGDLLNTINHNLTIVRDDTRTSHSRLQLSVAYDDLPTHSVELFRGLCTDKARELLDNLDRFLATQDRGTNPSVTGEGRHRAGMGIYFFEEELDPQQGPAPDNDSKR